MILNKILIILLIIVGFKLINNYIRFDQMLKFSRKYSRALELIHADEITEEADILFQEIRERKPIIQELIQLSSVKLPVQSVNIPDYKFGLVTVKKVNCLDYMLQGHGVVEMAVIETLDYTRGVYKQRMKDAVNPLYWINIMIFLPQELLHYFDYSVGNLFIKLINVVWWAFNLYLSLHSDLVKEFIYTLLSRLT